MKLFATCARGLEPVLANELRELGAANVERGRGGVPFTGDKGLLYQANLWLRTAVRVLRPILDVPVTTPEELYEAVRSIDWSEFMTPEHTLAVDCNVRDSRITHSKYAALKTKDAICDQFVDKLGRRPSVDVERPMVGLNLHIYKDHATLSLDSSGDSLHKRGYRPILTKAPLNEALAAGLVLLSNYECRMSNDESMTNDQGPNAERSAIRHSGSSSLIRHSTFDIRHFIDPLCGSGTLCIEAAWIATRRPPGLTRKHFGFMGWMDFDIRLWTHVRDEAREGVLKQLPAPIIGSDLRRDAIEFSNTNARAAGVGNLLRFERKDVKDFAPPLGRPGVILCNPPYGERIGEEKDLISLYRTLGDVFRRCAGWSCYVFTGNARLANEIGLQPAEQIPLFNGKIPCRLLRFQVN
jgi:putative N6-adenine-specific DNA methylase